MDTRPMPALWQASSARLMGASFMQPGVVAHHDHVDEAACRRVLKNLGLAGVVAREADELRLARLADGLGGLLEFLALGPLDLGGDVSIAQAVDEDQVDVIGLDVLEPLIQLA